jgi:hypothetical protein
LPARSDRSQSRRNPAQAVDNPVVSLSNSYDFMIIKTCRVKGSSSGMLDLDKLILNKKRVSASV